MPQPHLCAVNLALGMLCCVKGVRLLQCWASVSMPEPRFAAPSHCCCEQSAAATLALCPCSLKELLQQ